MSFLIDPPELFILGIALCFAGSKLRLLAKITIGLIIVFIFIFYSLLLYLDATPCIFPVICNNLSGPEFMFHSNITGVYKENVPVIVVFLLFALYPIWFYLGYIFAPRLLKQEGVQ